MQVINILLIFVAKRIKFMADYKFYMQRYPIITTDGNGITTKKVMPIYDLERDFVEMRYKSFTGLEDYGKPTVYTEKFAETEELSIYIPPVSVLENTELTLTVLFFGECRRDTYHQFVDYVHGSKLIYWDTCRERKVALYQSDAIKPATDSLYGSTPYMECPIKFTNIFGRTFDITEDFSNLR